MCDAIPISQMKTLRLPGWGPGPHLEAEALGSVCCKEVGTGFTEKSSWGKLAQECRGEMFGPSSEAGEKPSVSAGEGDWELRIGRDWSLLKTLHPSFHMVGAEQTAPNRD